MTQGYFAIVQNSGDVDYLDQAYVLAKSIRATQSGVNKLSIMVDEDTKKLITGKHRRIFDHIVDIPWQDDAKDAEWRRRLADISENVSRTGPGRDLRGQ